MTAFVVGDVLERDKGMVKHVGIFIGDDLVLHASPEHDVAITPMEWFAKGKQGPIKSTHEFVAIRLYLRARAAIARRERYDVLANNCFDLVKEIVTGRREKRYFLYCC